MKLNKALPHEAEQIIRMTLKEAEMISGRSLQDDTINAMIRFLMQDVQTKFSWLTLNYLKEAIHKGLSSDYKYLDYKTVCKWLYDYKNSPEMSLKIALESPLVPADVPEWMPVNWYMEVNKAYKRYCDGNINTAYLNTGIYSRLFIDGMIKMNAYQKHYKAEDGQYDMHQVEIAQRKIIAETFEQLKLNNTQYIYSPEQYFKA